MPKVVTITGQYVNSIPTAANRPGLLTGRTRDGFMKNLFSLATTHGWDIRVSGQHWLRPSGPSKAVLHMADDRLSRGEIKRRNDAYNRWLDSQGKAKR